VNLVAALLLLLQDDVADIASQEVKLTDEQRYFLVGHKKDAAAPAEGYSLVVVMPGGDGGAGFHPFVKRIYKNSLSDAYLVAQPVAIKWTEQQKIIWPTDKSRVEHMKVTTEQFVDAVLDDVGKKHKLNPERIFTLSWSSSGPAAYVISMDQKKRVTGSLVAMSVFKPEQLPLIAAKDHAYYLLHSKDDKITPFRFAEQADVALKAVGAKVEMATYDGGHGWRGTSFRDIRAGIEWLEKNHAPPKK